MLQLLFRGSKAVGCHHQKSISGGLRNPQPFIHSRCSFITVSLLLSGVSVPTATRNVTVVTHRLKADARTDLGVPYHCNVDVSLR